MKYLSYLLLSCLLVSCLSKQQIIPAPILLPSNKLKSYSYIKNEGKYKIDNGHDITYKRKHYSNIPNDLFHVKFYPRTIKERDLLYFKYKGYSYYSYNLHDTIASKISRDILRTFYKDGNTPSVFITKDMFFSFLKDEGYNLDDIEIFFDKLEIFDPHTKRHCLHFTYKGTYNEAHLSKGAASIETYLLSEFDYWKKEGRLRADYPKKGTGKKVDFLQEE